MGKKKRCFEGMMFCVTGTFSTDRKKLCKLLIDHGGIVRPTCAKDVDVLLCEQKGTSKYNAAISKGIPIHGESWLREQIQDFDGGGPPKKKAKTAKKASAPKGGKAKKGKATGKPLAGMTFCITGKFSVSRKALSVELVNAGAKVAGTVSNAVTHLLCEGDEGSSKYAIASGKGIPIKDEEWVRVRMAGEDEDEVEDEDEDEGDGELPDPPISALKLLRKQVIACEEDDSVSARTALVNNIKNFCKQYSFTDEVFDEDEDDGPIVDYDMCYEYIMEAGLEEDEDEDEDDGEGGGDDADLTEVAEKAASAAFSGDKDTLETLLKAHPALVAEKNSRDQTALYCAARNGHTELVATLLAFGSDVNARDANQSTPLHGAAFNDHSETVLELLMAGANKKLKNKFGSTAADEANNAASKLVKKHSGKRPGSDCSVDSKQPYHKQFDGLKFECLKEYGSMEDIPALTARRVYLLAKSFMKEMWDDFCADDALEGCESAFSSVDTFKQAHIFDEGLMEMLCEGASEHRVLTMVDTVCGHTYELIEFCSGNPCGAVYRDHEWEPFLWVWDGGVEADATWADDKKNDKLLDQLASAMDVLKGDDFFVGKTVGEVREEGKLHKMFKPLFPGNMGG